VAWGLLLVLLAAIYALTSLGGGSSDKPTTASAPTTPVVHHTTTTPATTPKATRHKAKSTSKIVRLQLVPTGTVSVCLKAAGGRTLLRDVTLSAGAKQRTYRSTEFRVTLGNNLVGLRIDGVLRHVPGASNGIGYRITSKGRRTLTAAQRPSCT
jgi:hypothetical protein